MWSGQKRRRDEYYEDEPQSKRSKFDSTKSPLSPAKHPWPQKQKTLSSEKLGQLPPLLNASLHIKIFESFWRKKGWGSPVVDCYQSDSSTPRQRLFQCQLLLINPRDESQRISVISGDFDSKKKATVDAHYQFNINYIPFRILKTKMSPFSHSQRATVSQTAVDRGSHLQHKTASIEMVPVPIQMHEADVIALLYTNQADKSKIENHKLVKFIEFYRVSPSAIYKKCRIQFDCPHTASKFVPFLNGKTYKNFTLRVTWKQELHSKPYLKTGRFLKVVGFPLNLKARDIRVFLGSKGVFPVDGGIVLCSRYSVFLEVFLEFEEKQSGKEAFDMINRMTFRGIQRRDGSFVKKMKQKRLYARYALLPEMNEAQSYEKDIAVKMSM